MTRKSFVTNAQDTIVDAAKTSAEGMKILAGEAAKAAAVAATGVIVEGVKYALDRGQNKVATKAARRKTKKPAKKKAVTKKKPVARTINLGQR